MTLEYTWFHYRYVSRLLRLTRTWKHKFLSGDLPVYSDAGFNQICPDFAHGFFKNSVRIGIRSTHRCPVPVLLTVHQYMVVRDFAGSFNCSPLLIQRRRVACKAGHLHTRIRSHGSHGLLPCPCTTSFTPVELGLVQKKE